MDTAIFSLFRSNLTTRTHLILKDVIGTDFLSLGGKTSPFQYLFIGGPKTNSKIHNDRGGMTILITCLVGRKKFTLIHRDDESLLRSMDARKEGPMSSRLVGTT
jgi:hypothetical protein